MAFAATAIANPNIAFIKYWGNRDHNLRIPSTGSISMNLAGLETRTCVHFDPELRGWEEKEKSVEFKLVRVTPGKVYFDGLTFEKISEKEINVYVSLEDKEKNSEHKFSYHRYKPQQ